MYQALYRKWRPRTFDDVVGQEHITATLKRQVRTGRLSHAYLFIGTRGTGKTTCAKILARAVNCERPVDGNPCNECAACRGIESGAILDVAELDAASNNRVDDVRALQDEAIFSPASVKKRVYIIDEVHMLSTAAFNALLKILEEPPEHLMFILCTTELNKVLPTIVSRCQRHSFKRIDPDAIARRLSYVAGQEGLTLTADAAALLAQLADGGMRDALSLLDQCSARQELDVDAVRQALGLAGSRRITELYEAVRARDSARALLIFDALWRDGKDPAGVLDELAGLLRDVMLTQLSPDRASSLLSGLYDPAALTRFASQTSGSDLMDGMEAIRAADLSGQNPRRAAELCLVKLCAPETGDSLAALKSRVSRLEAALKNGALPSPAPATYEPAAPVPDETPPEADAPPEVDAPPATDAPPEVDAPPWYTDDDAPPEIDVPPEADAPPEKQPPVPPPADAGEDAALWKELVRRLGGKLDMGVYAMLNTASQCTGTVSGDALTVRVATPMAKMLLDTPQNAELIRAELSALCGRELRVVFSDGAPAAPDPEKLGQLGKFANVTFE